MKVRLWIVPFYSKAAFWQQWRGEIMELRQLKYFIAAAKHLNFTKAANECSIVQTAMTQQIANLEHELNVKLFERNHRNLSLTAAGERFLKDARRIVNQAAASVAGMGDFKAGYEDVIRIGYHGEMFKQDLVEILKEFRKANPKTKVYLSQEPQNKLIESLEYGELDLIFTIYGNFFQSLGWMDTEILEENRVKLVVSRDHPLAKQEKVTLADLQAQPMIDFDERNQNEREVRWLQKGMVFDRYCLVTDHTSGEILIESGYGISFWVERMCDPEIYPNLCFIDIEDDEDIAKTCVAYRREELTLQCRTLIEYTKRYGRNH
jgi:DNA-binding transcriptional LysR family regulator